MRCVLTYLSGDKFAQLPEVSVYLNSLKHASGDKFVFTHDLNQENRDLISKYGITIIDVNNIQWIVRDRFRVYAEFLHSRNYEQVLMTDSKDVLFNSDPFDYFPDMPDLVLVSEGILHKQSLWNIIDQTGLQKLIKPDCPCEDWPVINGGVQMGKSKSVCNFCGIIYQMMVEINPRSTEQALINYMYNVHWKEKVVLADPSKDWFCCTGEPISRGIHDFPVDLATWKNPNLSKPYAIVHQWDRLRRNKLY